VTADTDEGAAVDARWRGAALQRLDALTKPRGSLGRLETLAVQLCTIQRTLTPRVDRPSILVFAADHGLARESISAYPREVTRQMLANFAGGGAAISVLARAYGARLRVIDAGVARPDGSGGSANLLQAPAMSRADCERAIEAGASVAESEIAAGADAVLLGEMGIGNTGIASLLVHALFGWPLADCVGRGTGLDDAGLAAKLEVLERARQARGVAPADPVALVADRGGHEFAMLIGAAEAAARRRCPVIVDGFATTVAIACAMRRSPALRECCVFAHVSAERAHRALLAALDVRALLDLELRLGEASGAALALPLIRAACELIAGMATMTEASIADRAPR
jgi:nicotinate-nucleotide--dimethylbenzimidazole phosphoribosyltransferase